jgi:hypothetical protein
MSQVQKERPQEKKPRPQENHGPTLDANIDIGDADDILKELEEIEHPNQNIPEYFRAPCCVAIAKKKSVR